MIRQGENQENKKDKSSEVMERLLKTRTIFISGDGGSWIKGFDEAFPNAIYVLDPFHYFNKKLAE